MTFLLLVDTRKQQTYMIEDLTFGEKKINY